MSDPWDEVEQWARSKKAEAAAAQQVEKTDSRFDELNTKVDTLAEAVTKFVESSSVTDPPSPEEEGPQLPTGEGKRGPTSSEKPPANPEPELPVETVTMMDVPRIYTGDDEPAEVSYVDGPSGETKTRPGRRKNHPTRYHVEAYEEPVPGEEQA